MVEHKLPECLNSCDHSGWIFAKCIPMSMARGTLFIRKYFRALCYHAQHSACEGVIFNTGIKVRRYLLIRLMRDYVACSKVTIKPRLRDNFSDLRFLRDIFTWVFFSSWLLWELVRDKLKICFLKPRLGGDFSLYDVMTHKGYSNQQFFRNVFHYKS